MAELPERSGAVDEDLAAGPRRVAGDAVERNGEGVGHDHLLVGQLVGDGEQHRGVGREQVGVPAGGVAGDAGMDAGADGPGEEVVTKAEVTGLARRAQRRHLRGARQPRVEHDPLPDLQALRLGTEGDDIGHDLVAHHLGERAQPAHGVVALGFTEVQQRLLGVRAADADQAGPGHHPIRPQRPGVLDLHELHRAPRQVVHQGVGVVRYLVRIGLDAEDKGPHSFASADRRMSALILMNPSMSDCLYSTTRLRSGR